jgi:predicted transcriptional regulator
MPRTPKRLTDAELELMQVIWDLTPEPVTVRQVADGLRAERGKDHAYTTVQTVLNILCRKGALRSRRGSGRALEYVALMTREDAASSMTRDLVERAFRGRVGSLFTTLLDEEDLSREELAELRRRIDRQLDGGQLNDEGTEGGQA